jgi:hypothetical protein
METFVGHDFSKRTTLTAPRRTTAAYRPGKSEHPLPPGPRLCALLSASGTGSGSSTLSAPSLYERSFDWRMGSFQVSMLEINLCFLLTNPDSFASTNPICAAFAQSRGREDCLGRTRRPYRKGLALQLIYSGRRTPPPYVR